MVADPNFWTKVTEIRWGLARRIPNAGFAVVEVHMGMARQMVLQ